MKMSKLTIVIRAEKVYTISVFALFYGAMAGSAVALNYVLLCRRKGWQLWKR